MLVIDDIENIPDGAKVINVISDTEIEVYFEDDDLVMGMDVLQPEKEMQSIRARQDLIGQLKQEVTLSGVIYKMDLKSMLDLLVVSAGGRGGRLRSKLATDQHFTMRDYTSAEIISVIDFIISDRTSKAENKYNRLVSISNATTKEELRNL